jgi:hypothetical protein
MARKIITTTLLLLLVMISTNAQTKDETAVAAVVEQLRNAMIDANRSVLENIVADKLSYGHSGGLVENKAEFIEKLVSGKSDFVTIDLKDQVISISDKTAIVRHQLRGVTNDSGKPGEVNLQILLVFQKIKKQWKLLARQAIKRAV